MVKKLIKLVCILFVVIVFVVARFYYSVYASEYECKEIDTNTIVNMENGVLRVATYNIKSMNYGESVEKFKADITGLDLDIIALQEVDQNAFRSGNTNMAKELAKVGDYPYYHFYSTMWILDGYYGIAILSKYPIVEVSSNLLPNSLFKEPRILTETKVRLGERIISIFSTHITYENNGYRKAQLQYVKNRLEKKIVNIVSCLAILITGE